MRRNICLLGWAAALYLAGAGGAWAAGAREVEEEPMPMTRVEPDAFTRASMMPSVELVPGGSFTPAQVPKALLVYADPQTDSITAAARNYMLRALTRRGWEVAVRDLYQTGFNPVPSKEEPSFTRKVKPSPDVWMEQEQFSQADVLILIYPLWWVQPPAMLKGWLDRVFAYGFAYEFVDGSPASLVSLLSEKKVLTINTAVSSKTLFREKGYDRYLMLAKRTFFEFSGMQVLGRHIIYSSTTMDMPAKKAAVEKLADLIDLF